MTEVESLMIVEIASLNSWGQMSNSSTLLTPPNKCPKLWKFEKPNMVWGSFIGILAVIQEDVDVHLVSVSVFV